jgi:hypothetical protein
VAEGQLSHCPLTFRHLQVIKETFLNILVGVYHSRVEYPEDSEKQKSEIKQKASLDTPTEPVQENETKDD